MSNPRVTPITRPLKRQNLPRNVEYRGYFDATLRSATSSKYFRILTTLVLGLGLYVGDIVSDIFVGFSYFLKGDLWWGSLSLGLIFIPGMLRGIYELNRRPIAYQNETNTFRLLTKDANFKHFNFGLDVFPKAYLRLQQGPFILRMVCVPMYILVMGVWFPFLPLIQYLRVAQMQLKITSYSSDNEMEQLNIEEHRAISMKSVETFLESAPQLFLQIYVSYKMEPGNTNWWSLMSIVFSFMAIVKTSIDLQEVDRFLKAVAISTLCFYTIHMKFNWIIMNVVLAILIFGNIAIRSLYTKTCRLLHGTMSVIAPVHMIIVKKNHFTEKLTQHFLGYHVMFNTCFHLTSHLIIHLVQTMDIFLEDQWTGRQKLFEYVLPTTAAMGIISVISSWIHWKWGLLELFRVECKYPNFEEKKKRERSYPKTWSDHYRHSPNNLATLGLFHGKDPSGPFLCCYDCGIKIRNPNDEMAPDILHAARLLQYKITYFKDMDTLQKFSPDEIRGAFNRANNVNPTCRVLERFRVDFKDSKIRLQTFGIHWVDQLPHGIRPYALAQAGFVATMGLTAVCYDCYALVDWTSAWAHLNTPWGLHSQHKRSSKCQFLQRALNNQIARYETFPNVWRLSKQNRLNQQCDHLSQAGFFCQMWRNGQAWMKCCNCPAYIFHLPFLESLKDNVKSLAPLKGESEMAGPNYQVFDKNTDFAYWTWIIHYVQSINCPFIQDHYRSEEARLRTFPVNWNAKVSANAVAKAGFIYFPLSSYTGAEEFKEIQKKPSAKTICPKCLCKIDWNNNKNLLPHEVRHCDKIQPMHQELISRVTRSPSTTT